jgi:hypothetical protein
MTTVFTTVWGHQSTIANAKGIAMVTAGAQDIGTHAISGGGFAETESSSNTNSTDVWGNDASGMVPIVLMSRQYDSNTDTTWWVLAFAAPPNTVLRCHTFAVTAEEVS